jgi:hypothetical protein
VEPEDDREAARPHHGGIDFELWSILWNRFGRNLRRKPLVLNAIMYYLKIP